MGLRSGVWVKFNSRVLMENEEESSVQAGRVFIVTYRRDVESFTGGSGSSRNFVAEVCAHSRERPIHQIIDFRHSHRIVQRTATYSRPSRIAIYKAASHTTLRLHLFSCAARPISP